MSPPIAVLGMYDFDEVRDATDTLWGAIAARLPDAPDRLTRPESHAELHASWRSPVLVLSQSCGWPLVTELADLVDVGGLGVVGTFYYTAADEPGYYRSVIVESNDFGRSESDGDTPLRAAVNSYDSLSGWVSLAAERGDAITDVVITGSHVASLAHVRAGSADVASIDAVTYSMLKRHRPFAVNGVHIVGRGPRVPCLPLSTTLDVDMVRWAIRDALDDATVQAATAELGIAGFVPLDAEAYASLREYSAVANIRYDRPGNSDRS